MVDETDERAKELYKAHETKDGNREGEESSNESGGKIILAVKKLFFDHVCDPEEESSHAVKECKEKDSGTEDGGDVH